MKINVPITEADRKAAEEEYALDALARAKTLCELAQKIENSEQLNEWERKVAGGSLRAAAKAIPDQNPQIGKSHKLPGDLLIHFIIKTKDQGMKKTPAIDALAEEYDASPQAVKKALGLIGKDAKAKKRKAELDHWIAIRNEATLNKTT